MGHNRLYNLLHGNQQLFDSSCALRKIRQGFQQRFEVRLRRGAAYVFEQTNRGYVITDGSGGRWPVQIDDWGNCGIFSWPDMRLEVTQRSYMSQSNGKFQRDVNNFMIDLFN